MEELRKAWMALASNKVHMGKKVAFGGYIIDGTMVHADPKKVLALTKFPLPKCLMKLRGCLNM